MAIGIDYPRFILIVINMDVASSGFFFKIYVYFSGWPNNLLLLFANVHILLLFFKLILHPFVILTTNNDICLIFFHNLRVSEMNI